MSTAATAYQELVQLLTPEQGVGEAQSIARLLFEDLLTWHRGRRDRALSSEEEALYQDAKIRLLNGEPVQYITGRADFYGMLLEVSPAVLIPRPETEELVEWVLSFQNDLPDDSVIMDVGTGSGCIPLAIKQNWPNAAVHGMDVSKEALAIAAKNATQLELDVQWWEQDVRDELRWEQLPELDVLISNPPYIPRREAELMPEGVKAYEPHLALFVADDDPLVFYRRIMELALYRLKPGGLLFFECNEFNAREVHELGQQLGFEQAELRQDLQGKWRMWKGYKAP